MIACHHYDHLEVICIYHYHVAVRLKDNTIHEGEAETLRKNNGGEEILILKQPNGTQDVILTQIARIDIQTKGARIQRLDFP